MNYGLGVVVIPVSDVDKAKDFYQALGWRLNANYTGGPDYRVVQLTPPGSACSVIFGTGVSSAAPGSAQGLLPGIAGTVGTCSGPFMSAEDSIKVTVYGRGSHGALPQNGIDPVVLAAMIIVRLQTVVSREVTPGEIAIVTVGSVQAGTRATSFPTTRSCSSTCAATPSRPASACSPRSSGSSATNAGPPAHPRTLILRPSRASRSW